MTVSIANVPATTFGAVSGAGSGLVLSGGVASVASWKAARDARACSFLGIPASQLSDSYTDLTDNGASTPQVKSASASANTYPTSPRGGLVLLQTTATANQWAGIGYLGNGNIGNIKNDKWLLAARVLFTAGDANSSYQIAVGGGVGGLDATSGVNAGAGVNVINGVANLVLNNAGATTTVALTWTFDTTLYHDVEVFYDLTTVICHFDGVEVGRTTTLTNMPTTAGAGRTASVANGATTASRLFRVEKIGVWCDQAA
jgi:hypothetical protein